jgi:hypothetical protein
VRERTAALALDAEIEAMTSGSPDVTAGERSAHPELILLAGRLRALAVEWKERTPHALGQRVALVRQSAASAVEERQAPAPSLVRLRVRPLVAVSGAAVLLVVAIPGARNTVARQIDRLLDIVRIGPNTEVVRRDESTAGEIAASLQQHERDLASGKRWSIHTAYGGFGGTVPPGASPGLQRLDRLDILSSLTSMSIQVPTAMYRGATPVFHHALLSPDGLLLLFFGSENTEILLVQAPVGGGRAIAYSRVVDDRDTQGRLVLRSPELKTEELSLAGGTVMWDPDNTGRIPNSSALRWERDGVSYSLFGRALTREEAVELFLSLRPR